MLLQRVKDFYRSLPPWVTAPVKYIPDGVLFGASFRACVPRTDVGCLGENLKAALGYAREHTAWGREKVPARIDAADAEKILADLPCVTSAELAADPRRFVSDEATDVNSYETTTGGSGRNPTTIRLSNASYGVEWKHMLDIWKRGGYSRQKDVKITFRGYHLKPGELVRRDPIYNELSVDPFQLNDDNFPDLLRQIKDKGVTCLHGYPSLIKMFKERLARFSQPQHQPSTSTSTLFPVREIMLGSEGASDALKKELAEFFGARIISWYGLTEKVVLAYDEFAQGRFVNFTSYGYPRIVDAGSDGVGEIVGTTFVNKAMPLVNYRTGDYGRIVRENGQLIIEALQGRWGKDFVYRTVAEKIPTSAINLHGPVQTKIVFYQIVQNEYGRVLVRVLPKQDFVPDEIRREMLQELSERLKGFEIDCQVVASDADFERSIRGKLIMLVQNLNLKDLAGGGVNSRIYRFASLMKKEADYVTAA